MGRSLRQARTIFRQLPHPGNHLHCRWSVFESILVSLYQLPNNSRGDGDRLLEQACACADGPSCEFFYYYCYCYCYIYLLKICEFLVSVFVSYLRFLLKTQGTMPFRMLAAEYGAHITYGEEIIDHKILKCDRRVNGLVP